MFLAPPATFHRLSLFVEKLGTLFDLLASATFLFTHHTPLAEPLHQIGFLHRRKIEEEFFLILLVVLIPGMGASFMERHKLNPHECLAVGDMKSDQTFAFRCGFQFEWAEEFFA